MDLSVFISVVLRSFLVAAVSALVSIAYVITGLTHVLYNLTLLSMLMCLFLQIMSRRYPDIIVALLVCALTFLEICDAGDVNS